MKIDKSKNCNINRESKTIIYHMLDESQQIMKYYMSKSHDEFQNKKLWKMSAREQKI